MSLYTIFNSISIVVLLAYNLLHYREKKQLLGGVSQSAIKRFEAKEQKGIYRVLSSVGFWTVIEIWLVFLLQYYLTGSFNGIFGNIVNTGANYYGLMFFAPPLVIAFCFLMKIDPLAQMDLIAPAYPLALVFVKIACFFGGCCRGVPWEHGFYNPVSRLIEFPTQFLESAVALLLFVFLQLCKKKFKKGTVFPIYLMTYSALRFFTEFTRVESEVFMGLKTYQILCIVGVAVGALEYLAARKYDACVKRKEEPCHSGETDQGGNGLD